MGTPAAVMGDQVTATCMVHQIPNPTTGAPQPAPPLPFAAPLLTGLATRTFIGGKAAAVQGSSGVNTPPHPGLHASDPFMTPTTQQARVTVGSASVLIEGKPAARTGSTCTVCANAPGQLTGSAATVLIGG
jgi:uncharacterized Zn-binding protein involved in type VI secretion